MHFSVIIPTLGRSHLLRQTLGSVARCRPQPEEVIVVDGDPDESARAVTESLQDVFENVVYVSSEPGLTRQRNVGMGRATGDVLVFFDDDVEVDPQVFRVLMHVYEDRSIVGSTGRVTEPGSDRIVGKHSPIRRLLPGGGVDGRFTRYGYPRRLVDTDTPRDIEFLYGSFMTVRSEVARAVRFDENLPGYGLAEDEDFSYRVSRFGRIRYVPEAELFHAKAGHGSRDPRAFGRQVVVNRAYLFRKNFIRTPLARMQFGLLVLLLLLHRAVNRDWREVLGLAEGSVLAWRQGRRDGGSAIGTGVPVAFISSHSKLGGSESYLETLLDRLGQPWIGQVVCLEEGPLVSRLRAKHSAVSVVPTGNRISGLVASALKVRRELVRTPPLVVHANGLKAAVVCSLATLGTRLPIVWVKHDFSYDGRLTRVLAGRCRLVVGVSAAVTRSLRRRRDKIRVVHSGIEVGPVDRERGKAAVNEALGGAADSFVVGLVGRLHPVKGHSDLLEAGARLNTELRRFRIVFVGGEDPSAMGYEKELRRLTADLGIVDVVDFLGHRADARLLISGFDATAIPSRSRGGGGDVEGFPLTALEALAAGTPVVAYATGGLPELIGDCGVLLPQGNIPALTGGLQQILEDPALRKQLSACGQARARENFRVEGMVDSMKRIYLEAAGRGVV